MKAAVGTLATKCEALPALKAAVATLANKC